MMLEKRSAIQEINHIQLATHPMPPVTAVLNQITLTPIDWGGGLPDYPKANDVTGLPLQNRVLLLARASEEFDRIKREYLNLNKELTASGVLPKSASDYRTYTEHDLPSLGPIHPGNLEHAIQTLALNVSRLRVLDWKPLVYRYDLGSTGFPFTSKLHYSFGNNLEKYGFLSTTHNSIEMTPLTQAGQTVQSVFDAKVLQSQDIGFFGHLPPGPTAFLEFDWYGKSHSEGFFYRFDPLAEVDGVDGLFHLFEEWTQEVTYFDPDEDLSPGYEGTGIIGEFQFLTDHPLPDPDFHRSLGPDDSQMRADRLVLGAGPSLNFDPLPALANYYGVTAFEFRPQWALFWDSADDPEPADADPERIPDPANPNWSWIESDPDYSAMEGKHYVAQYSVFGLIFPEFQYCAEPAVQWTTGPGTLGRDGVYSMKDPSRPGSYFIELGDGRTLRGNQGTLVINSNGHIRFMGDLNEYEIPEFEPTRQVYLGGRVKTIVARDETDEDVWVIEQTLAEQLPGGMGVQGERLKTFTITRCPEGASPCQTELTCEYVIHAGTPLESSVIRNFSGFRLLAGELEPVQVLMQVRWKLLLVLKHRIFTTFHVGVLLQIRCILFALLLERLYKARVE